MRPKSDELFLRGHGHVIRQLFQVLRYNGIESCVPIDVGDGFCYLICLQGRRFDQLICSWKDQIMMTKDPARWPKFPTHDS